MVLLDISYRGKKDWWTNESLIRVCNEGGQQSGNRKSAPRSGGVFQEKYLPYDSLTQINEFENELIIEMLFVDNVQKQHHLKCISMDDVKVT